MVYLLAGRSLRHVWTRRTHGNEGSSSPGVRLQLASGTAGGRMKAGVTFHIVTAMMTIRAYW